MEYDPELYDKKYRGSYGILVDEAPYPGAEEVLIPKQFQYRDLLGPTSGWSLAPSWQTTAPTYTPRQFINDQGQTLMADDPYQRTLFQDEFTNVNESPTPEISFQWDEGNPLSGYLPYYSSHGLRGVTGATEMRDALRALGAYYDPDALNNHPENLWYYVSPDKKAEAEAAMGLMQPEQQGLTSGVMEIAQVLGTIGGMATLGSALAGGNSLLGSLSGTPSTAATTAGTAGTTAAAGSAGGNSMGWLSDLWDSATNLFGNGTGNVSEAAFQAADAAQLAQQGLSSSQIGDILAQAGGGLSSDVISNLASLASQGLPDSALQSYLTAAGVPSTTATSSLLSNIRSALGGTSGSGQSSGSISNLELMGRLLGTGLGMYGANQQANTMSDLANQFAGYGAPYRQKLSDLYANPDSFLQSNEVQKPVQMGTDIMARSLSTQGNPTGSGRALQQLQSYSSDQLYSRLGQEKDRLAGFGGLASYNAAAPAAAANAAGQSNNWMNVAGAGIADIFNPPKSYGSLSDLLRGR